MTINTFDAVRFAQAYHDVMTLSRTGSAFHLPVNVGPRAALASYLSLCSSLGVQPHNEHWVAHMERTIDGIEKRRAA